MDKAKALVDKILKDANDCRHCDCIMHHAQMQKFICIDIKTQTSSKGLCVQAPATCDERWADRSVDGVCSFFV